MTRRGRLEAKAKKRQEWAEKAETRAAQRFAAARAISDLIPLGQPILIGHHSERRARRDADRIHANLSKGVQESDLAAHHAAKAEGLERQLGQSVFSDDADAIQQLEARIAERTAQLERRKAINKEIRRGPGWEARLAPPLTEAEKAELLSLARAWAGVYKPGFPAYSLTNLSATIRRDRGHIQEIEQRATRAKQAETANSGVLIEGDGQGVRVTFAEKPARTVLETLKAAGFRWHRGSWIGRRDRLPAELEEG